MPPKPKISHSQVKNLMKNHHMTLTQAADALGVSKQLAEYHLYHTGPGYTNPLKEARESMPWQEVEGQFKAAPPYKRVAWHAEYIATGGEGMTANKLRYLRQWYQRLTKENEVVVYDPAIPPHRGVKTGGWDYVPREKSDGDLLFRANEYTTVTEETKVDWRLPPKELWPQE